MRIPLVRYGTTVTGSRTIAKQTIEHDDLSAVGQCGIVAGQCGFDIRAGGNTDWQGAAITRQVTADLNQLQIGSLTSRDLSNYRQTQARSSSIGIAYGGQ